MGALRFTRQFKKEAVKELARRGNAVSGVSARLGVSARSLYKQVNAVASEISEQQTKELLEAKSEILRLRSQLWRTEEERDLLKSAAWYF